MCHTFDNWIFTKNNQQKIWCDIAHKENHEYKHLIIWVNKLFNIIIILVNSVFKFCFTFTSSNIDFSFVDGLLLYNTRIIIYLFQKHYIILSSCE